MTPKTYEQLVAVLKGRGWLLCQSQPLEGEAKEWIALVPTGKFESHWQHPEGFTVTADHLAEMVTNFGIYNNEALCDWEHESAWGGNSRASGWIKAVEIRDGKLWGKVEWTPTALQQITDREYRYISPAFKLKYEDPRTGQEMGARLFSIALTNTPYFETDLMPIAAKKGEDMSAYKKIAAALGLPETAGEADILAAMQQQQTQLTELAGAVTLPANPTLPVVLAATKTRLETLTAASAVLEQIRTELKISADAKPDAYLAALKLREGDATLSAKVAELETTLAARTADELVKQAMTDGKITAATKIWATTFAKADAKGFEIWLASAPVIVPVGGPPKTPPKNADGSPIPTDSEIATAKAMGHGMTGELIAAQRAKMESAQEG